MKSEDKELLVRDLSARLPYGVICQYNCVIPCGRITLEKTNERDVLKGIIPMSDGHIGFMVGVDKVNALEGDIKPCLRPLSSMTEEEKQMLNNFASDMGDKWFDASSNNDRWAITIENSRRSVEYLCSKHLDLHGLIPKGLALEAPEGMYDI